ncbi:hypothetical protein YA0697_07820 [Pseudomonas viridiflava]|uniref:hypothetical protein n=1 Tax=Pseudomonas viridiflava TaxID=33069 RepID=UPI0018E62076|nr:hypothetical protein [Pseudomonas viridiflava]MBI6681617.1 hypothetical protein [Pseudomonas viridiflava]
MNDLTRITPMIQETLQQALRALLGKGFVVMLFGSEDKSGAMQYHLRIDHERTGLGLEHKDGVHDGFVKDIFLLATRMKAMLSRHETLSRMGGNGKVRLLTWITEDDSAAVMQVAEQAQRDCVRALRIQDSKARSLLSTTIGNDQ